MIVNKPLAKGKIHSLKFKIIKTEHRNFKIGVTNRKQTQNSRNPSNDQSVYYMVDNCNICFEGKTKNKYNNSIKEGSIVFMRIDLIKGEISWTANSDTIFHPKSNKFLLDPQVECVPFVAFYRTGDCLEWMK